MVTACPHDVRLLGRGIGLVAPAFGSSRRMLAAMFQTAAIERKRPMDRVKPVRIARGFFVALALSGGLVAGLSGIADAQVTLGAPARQAPPARQTTGFINRVFHDDAGEHKYVLFLPPNYSPEAHWPVILYLHGAGERGTDGTLQTTVGLGPFVKARRDDFSYVVVFPQCEDQQIPILQAWSPNSADGKRALAILSQVEREYSIDARRRILTGWSMGGYGTWSLGAADASHWAALVPVSGGGDPAWGSRLANVPIWAFAGANDRGRSPSRNRTHGRRSPRRRRPSSADHCAERRSRRLERRLQRLRNSTRG